MSGLDGIKRLDEAEVARLIKKDIMDEEPSEVDRIFEEIASKEIPQALPQHKAIPAIKIIALIVAIVSELVSSWYTFSWYKVNQPVPLALTLACILGVCEAMLPELAIFMFRKKGVSYKFGSFVIAILAFMATSFSTGATIGGLYDSRSKVLATKNVDRAAAIASTAELRDLSERRARAIDSLQSYKKDEALYSAKVVELVSNNEIATTMETKRDRARAAITRTEVELGRIESAINSLRYSETGSITIRIDFYSFLAGRVGLSADSVEFIMISFPAVFNEIVAPAMLTMVLFL